MKERAKPVSDVRGPSVMRINKAPCLVLAMSAKPGPKKASQGGTWIAVARMGYFAIYREAWGTNWSTAYAKRTATMARNWYEQRRIARRRPQHGKAYLEKLSDFDLDEHQAVIAAMNRMLWKHYRGTHREHAA